jgi:hypothetical protein
MITVTNTDFISHKYEKNIMGKIERIIVQILLRTGSITMLSTMNITDFIHSKIMLMKDVVIELNDVEIALKDVETALKDMETALKDVGDSVEGCGDSTEGCGDSIEGCGYST